MPNAIKIREALPEDEPGIIKLLSSFYANIKDKAAWEDTYVKSPDGRAVVVVAEDVASGRIVGHYSAIKMKHTVFGEKLLAAKGEGEIFDLDYIKTLMKSGVKIDRGVSTELVRRTLEGAAASGMELVCTNPSPLAIKSHLEAGYEKIKHDFSIFVMIFKSRYMRHLLSKEPGFEAAASFFISHLFTMVLAAIYFCGKAFSRCADVEIEEIGNFDERTDIFAEDLLKKGEVIAIDRNHDHLNWRFGKKEYKKYIVRSLGKDIGYMVVHVFINPNGFKEASLSDHLFLFGSWDKFECAIIKLMDEAAKEGCDLFRVNYLYDSKEKYGISSALKRLFPIRRRDERNITVFLSGRLADKKEKILDARNWYFTDLYFEGY